MRPNSLDNVFPGHASDATKPDQALREEFNRWAEAGRGAEMELDHLPITLPCWRKCGWRRPTTCWTWVAARGGFSRRLAKLVPERSRGGIDISDEMIRSAAVQRGLREFAIRDG